MPLSWRDWWQPPNPGTPAGALRVRQYVEWVNGLGALSESYRIDDAGDLADPELLAQVVRFLVPGVQLPRRDHACHGPRLSSDRSQVLSPTLALLEDAIMAIWEHGGAPPPQAPDLGYTVLDIESRKPDAIAKLLHGIFKAFLLSELVPQLMDMVLWYNQTLRPYHKQLARTASAVVRSSCTDVTTAEVLHALADEFLDCSAWICCFHAHCQPAYMLDLGTVYWAPDVGDGEQLLANAGFCFSMFEVYEIRSLYSLKEYARYPHPELVALQAYIIWKVLRTYPSIPDLCVRALNFLDQSALLRAARLAVEEDETNPGAAGSEAEGAPPRTPPRTGGGGDTSFNDRHASASPHSGYVDALRVARDVHGAAFPASPHKSAPPPPMLDPPSFPTPLPNPQRAERNLARMLKVMIRTHKTSLLQRADVSEQTRGLVERVADDKWVPKPGKKPPRSTYPIVDDKELEEAEKQRLKQLIAEKKKPPVPRFSHGPAAQAAPAEPARVPPPPRKPRPPTVNRGDPATAQPHEVPELPPPPRKPGIPPEARGKPRKHKEESEMSTTQAESVTSPDTPPPRPWQTPPAGLRKPTPAKKPAPKRPQSLSPPRVFETGNDAPSPVLSAFNDAEHVFESFSQASQPSPQPSPRGARQPPSVPAAPEDSTPGSAPLSDGCTLDKDKPSQATSLGEADARPASPASIDGFASKQSSASESTARSGKVAPAPRQPLSSGSGARRLSSAAKPAPKPAPLTPGRRRSSSSVAGKPPMLLGSSGALSSRGSLLSPRAKKPAADEERLSKKSSYAQLHKNANAAGARRMAGERRRSAPSLAASMGGAKGRGLPGVPPKRRRASATPPPESTSDTFVSGSPMRRGSDTNGEGEGSGRADAYHSPGRGGDSSPARGGAADKLESPAGAGAEDEALDTSADADVTAVTVNLADASPNAPQLMPRHRAAYTATGPPSAAGTYGAPYTAGYTSGGGGLVPVPVPGGAVPSYMLPAQGTAGGTYLPPSPAGHIVVDLASPEHQRGGGLPAPGYFDEYQYHQRPASVTPAAMDAVGGYTGRPRRVGGWESPAPPAHPADPTAAAAAFACDHRVRTPAGGVGAGEADLPPPHFAHLPNIAPVRPTTPLVAPADAAAAVAVGSPINLSPDPPALGSGDRALAEEDVVLVADLGSVRRRWAHKTAAPIGSPTSVLDLYLGERALSEEDVRILPTDPLILSPVRSPGLFIADGTPTPGRQRHVDPDATLLQLYNASLESSADRALKPTRLAPPPPPVHLGAALY